MTREEVEVLIAKLRKHAGLRSLGLDTVQRLNEAADALTSLLVRLSEVEKALEPFARHCNELEAMGQTFIDQHYGPYFHGLLKGARAALAEKP